MSEENVELVRAAFENFLAGEGDWGAELVAPEIEWDASEGSVPGISGIYRGREGVRKFWREWLAAWETVQFEYQLVDAGHHVVALIDQRMRGRSTGIEVEFGEYAHLYTFRDGSIVHWKLYMSHAAALEAAGLSEQAMSQQNVEVVRAVIDGWLRGDSATLDLISKEVVYVSPPTVPDAKTYRGHEGVLQWVVDWRQEWTDYELELEEIEEIGTQVMTIERHRATGKRSGVVVEMQSFSLWTLRDGKVLRWQGYASRDEALEAAGISEPPG